MAPFFIGSHIAINCFTDVPHVERYAHFITHISNSLTCPSIELCEKLKPVYTSSFFAWYMVTYLGVRKDIFDVKTVGEEQTIYKDGKEISFVFLNARGTEPNLMILFKNNDGDELFASHCKITEEIFSSEFIKPYLSTLTLKNLYFDGSYMNSCRIPSQIKMLRSITRTIKNNKRKPVYITASRLGNEAILSSIARAVNKKIFVSPEKFDIIEKLGYSKFFTTDPTTTYIRTIDYNEVSVRKVLKRNTLLGSSITIVLSMKAYLNELSRRDHFEKYGVFMYPITQLNTTADLKALRKLRARQLVFTNLSQSTSCSDGNHEFTSPEINCVIMKKYTKVSLDRSITAELQKCEPEYWMKWGDYLDRRGSKRDSKLQSRNTLGM